MSSPWLSTQQAADYLGFSVWTIRRLRNAGHIKEHRAPGVDSPRFHKDDLDRLMKNTNNKKNHEKQGWTHQGSASWHRSSTTGASVATTEGCAGEVRHVAQEVGQHIGV